MENNKTCMVNDCNYGKLAFLAFFPITGILGIHDYLSGRKRYFIVHIVMMILSSVAFIFSLGGGRDISETLSKGFNLLASILILMVNLFFAIGEGTVFAVRNAQIKRPKGKDIAMRTDKFYAVITVVCFLLILAFTSPYWTLRVPEACIFGACMYRKYFIALVFLILGLTSGIVGAVVARRTCSISLWSCIISSVVCGVFVMLMG